MGLKIINAFISEIAFAAQTHYNLDPLIRNKCSV